jgi:beta-glucosidase-like glycosyl hydrolase
VKTLDRPEHRKLARDMAEESFVLAINQNGTLPINGIRSKRIHLVGWLADSTFDHCGSYFNVSGHCFLMHWHVCELTRSLDASGWR